MPSTSNHENPTFPLYPTHNAEAKRIIGNRWIVMHKNFPNRKLIDITQPQTPIDLPPCFDALGLPGNRLLLAEPGYRMRIYQITDEHTVVPTSTVIQIPDTFLGPAADPNRLSRKYTIFLLDSSSDGRHVLFAINQGFKSHIFSVYLLDLQEQLSEDKRFFEVDVSSGGLHAIAKFLTPSSFAIGFNGRTNEQHAIEIFHFLPGCRPVSMENQTVVNFPDQNPSHRGLRDFGFSPDGSFFHAVHEESGAIAVWNVNCVSGQFVLNKVLFDGEQFPTQSANPQWCSDNTLLYVAPGSADEDPNRLFNVNRFNPRTGTDEVLCLTSDLSPTFHKSGVFFVTDNNQLIPCDSNPQLAPARLETMPSTILPTTLSKKFDETLPQLKGPSSNIVMEYLTPLPEREHMTRKFGFSLLNKHHGHEETEKKPEDIARRLLTLFKDRPNEFNHVMEDLLIEKVAVAENFKMRYKRD